MDERRFQCPHLAPHPRPCLTLCSSRPFCPKCSPGPLLVTLSINAAGDGPQWVREGRHQEDMEKAQTGRPGRWDGARSAVPEAAGSSDRDWSKGCGVLGEGGRAGVRAPWPVLGLALLSSPTPLHQALAWQPELRRPVGCLGFTEQEAAMCLEHLGVFLQG